MFVKKKLTTNGFYIIKQAIASFKYKFLTWINILKCCKTRTVFV